MTPTFTLSAGKALKHGIAFVFRLLFASVIAKILYSEQFCMIFPSSPPHPSGNPVTFDG